SLPMPQAHVNRLARLAYRATAEKRHRCGRMARRQRSMTMRSMHRREVVLADATGARQSTCTPRIPCDRRKATETSGSRPLTIEINRENRYGRFDYFLRYA